MLIFILLANVYAATTAYEIKLDLTLNNRHIGASTLKLKENQSGTFKAAAAEGQAFVTVTPSKKLAPYAVPPVHLKYTVGTIGPNGIRRVILETSIDTFADRKANTVVTNKKGEKLIALEATVRRIQN